MRAEDPVFQALQPWKCRPGDDLCPAGWYFWGETWIYSQGPFETEELAREACNEYARYLDTGFEGHADRIKELLRQLG